MTKYMYDGQVHPNAEGMDLMTQAVISAFLDEDITIYDIAMSLTNVTTDNNATKKRTVKESGKFYSAIIRDDGVSDESFERYVKDSQYKK